MKNDPGNQPAPPPSVPDHELLRRIGVGSYGEVWLARNVVGGYRAVKIVYRKTFDNDRPYEREFNGIKEYEPVSHSVEGLVHLLHVGRNDAEGCFHYVMELADDQQGGQQINPATYQPRTLRSEIHRRGRLPFEECLPLALSLAAALERLHSQRLVHRDVKPSNIIFVNGVPKLADIGLVASLDASRSFVGTEGYVPLDGPGTPRADVYALGKVLYEASTGRDRQDYPELPTQLKDFVDKEAVVKLNEVIVRACDPKPRTRYTSAAEMQADLLLLQQGKRLAKRNSPHRPFAVAAALAVVLLASTLFVTRGPNLKLVRTIEPPGPPPLWSGHVADWNGDGALDLLAANSNRFLVFSTAGELLAQWKPPEVADHGLSLDTVLEGRGDQQCRALVAWQSGTNQVMVALQPELLDREGYRIRFGAQGYLPTSSQPELSGTILAALKVVELAHDGQRQLLAKLNSGYGHLPRGLYSFSFDDGTELWHRYTAPAIFNIECFDLDGDRCDEIICGTSGPNNGNHAEDGTDDSHSYILAFSADGDQLWNAPLGPELSQSRPIVVRMDRAGNKRLCAVVTFSGQDRRQEEGLPAQGLVVALDNDGNVTSRTNVNAYIQDYAVADLDSDGQEEMVFALHGGELLVLRADLTLKARRPLAPNMPTNSFLHIAGVGDLNHDGKPELAVLSARYELASPVYLGRPGEPVTRRVFPEPRLHILDGGLRRIAMLKLADQWADLPGMPPGRVDDFERSGRNQLLFFADKPYMVELQPRQFLGLW
ncbi:MAG TPA: protein kinase [Verrucomicrobiae bacterium]